MDFDWLEVVSMRSSSNWTMRSSLVTWMSTLPWLNNTIFTFPRRSASITTAPTAKWCFAARLLCGAILPYVPYGTATAKSVGTMALPCNGITASTALDKSYPAAAAAWWLPAVQIRQIWRPSKQPQTYTEKVSGRRWFLFGYGIWGNRYISGVAL